MYLVPGGGGTWSGGVPGPREGVPGPGGCTCSGGVYLVQGVYLVPVGCTWSWGVNLVPGGCTWSWGGVPGPREGVPGQVLLPHVDRITDACKNITLPQLRCGR